MENETAVGELIKERKCSLKHFTCDAGVEANLSPVVAYLLKKSGLSSPITDQKRASYR